jgi:hypothetical protein
LRFVRRDAILLQRGNELRSFPPPSLGVSSLDLGRLLCKRPFFLVFSAIFSGKTAEAVKAGSLAQSESNVPRRQPKTPGCGKCDAAMQH